MTLPARGAAIAAAVLFALSCSQAPPAGPSPLAIVRFDNLTGDSSLDWTRRAIAHQLAAQLGASRRFVVMEAPGADVSQQRAAIASSGGAEILRGYLSQAGSRLRLSAELESPARRRVLRSLESVGDRAAGVIPLADEIARQLDAEAHPPGTRTESAYALLIQGLESADSNEAARAFDRASAADPAFPAPYFARLQLALARQDRAAATHIVDQARAVPLRQFDLARLEADASQLADAPVRVQKLAALSRLTPSDPAVLRKLGLAALLARQRQEAVDAFQRMTAIDPRNPDGWNNLGYAHAFAGDLDSAARSLREYQRLRPGDPNPLDSLGEVHFYLGRFREAEEFFRQAHRTAPAFLAGSTLAKAAQARFRSGDRSGADAIFNEYLGSVRNAAPGTIESLRARWEDFTGRRREAVVRLERIARESPGEASSGAYCQLSVWRLLDGDRGGAQEFARRAAASARDAESAGIARIAALLAAPPADPSEWAKRAAAAFPDARLEPVRNIALAFALLQDSRFEAALPILRSLYDKAPPSVSSEWPPLLGWCLLETGARAEARILLSKNYLAPFTNSAPFTAIWTSRFEEWQRRANAH